MHVRMLSDPVEIQNIPIKDPNWTMHDMEQGAQKQKQETKRHEQHENNAPTAGTQGG